MSLIRILSQFKPWHIDVGAAALLVLLAAGVYWTEVSASLDRHDALRARVRELDSRRAKQRELEKSIAGIKQRADAATKLIAQAGFTLDSARRVNARLAEITDLAASCAVQVEAIEPSRPIPSGRLVAITIRLTGKGGYAGVSKLIHEVRDRLPDCAITSLELTAAPSAQEPVVNVNAQITWHARPDNAVASN